MGYAIWVAAGIVLAAVVARVQPKASTLEPAQRQALSLAALAGAIFGAYGLQLPADLLGWHAPPPPGVHGDPLGGRTVLGGLLGGWLGVEGMKLLAGIRRPTGGDFALPLAIALGCGRLGCFVAGCCAGTECAPGWFATCDAIGTPRVPTQLIEAGYHFVAVIPLADAAWRGRWSTTRLPAYLAGYAVVRFVVEFWRQHPPMLAGLTWHQLLAVALFALTFSVWLRRACYGASAERSDEQCISQ
ncbi:MAG: prolipoprotein diacylglyceryl transferase [Planctomycetota bacterium]